MILKSPINNMIGGVSQQPSTVRSADQCSEMINAWPSPVDGLTKRQPTRHIAKIIGFPDESWKYHAVDRYDAEKYIFVFKPGAVEAYDLGTGASYLVRDIPGGGFTYLVGTAPFTDVVASTVADYTFVVNKLKVVAMSGSTTAAHSPIGEAYVFVRQGNYNTKYAVRVKVGATDQSFSFSTWDGVNSVSGSSATPVWPAPTQLNSINTNDIAEQIRLGIANFATPYTAVRSGSVVKLTNSSVFDVVEPTDGVGDTVLSVAHKQIPRVAGYLPEICSDGFRIKVIGDAEVDADDYWVKFVADAGSGAFGRGSWQEDLGYSEEYAFDLSTMPHTLIRKFDDGAGTITGTPYKVYFDWTRGTWANKIVGDSIANPRPGFVGKSINSVFYLKERLGFLSDEKVTMSETGNPFNFWRTTLLVLEDTAPINVISTGTPPPLFLSGVEYNEDVLLQTGRRQYILRGGEILSPRTVQITAVSNFENIATVLPVNSGRSVFFPFIRGDQSGVREFYQFGDQSTFDAADVSVQVPNYIEGTITYMAVSTLEDTLVVFTQPTNRLYVYKFLWSGESKIVSSWGAWDFPAGCMVHYGYFINNSLYLVIEYSDGIYLERLEIATGIKDDNTDYTTLLDRRIDQTQVTSAVYSALYDRTTITVPYIVTSGTLQVVEKETGLRGQIVASATNSVTIRGDWSSRRFWVGVGYTMSYRFSEPTLKLPAGRGVTPATGAKVKAKRIGIEYHDSGPFTVTVTVGNRATYTYEVASPELSFGAVAVDDVVLKTDSRNIPIQGRAREVECTIINDGPYPSNLTSAEWTFTAVVDGQRVS